MVVLLNSLGNQVVHSRLKWPMLAVDLFQGLSQAQGKSGLPVVHRDPRQEVEAKADIHTVTPVRFCREMNLQEVVTVRFAQQYLYLQ